MTTTSSIAVGAASSLVKRILDDTYSAAKEASIGHIARARADLRDAAVTKALTSITKIKTLWSIEKEVSLYEFFYPAEVEFPGGMTKAIRNLKELGGVKNFVIQGTAGQGKSVFLRYLAGQELKPGETSERVPLFIELRRLRPDLPLEDLVLQTLEKYKLPHTAKVWQYLAGSGKFVLLLDAFDEIESPLVDRAVSDIEAIAELYREKLQIIITSRPEADIQRSNRFRVLKLAPLTPQDHLPFLERICPDAEQAKDLEKLILKSSIDIRGLLTTPLMMTLLVILYKSLQTIPDTLPKFYEELFDVLFYRHDQSKPGFRRKRFTQLDDSKVKKLFAALCFVVRSEGHSNLTTDKLRESIAKAASACNESVDSDKFRDELTKTVCLMVQDGLEYSFIHKSVTQYYAASFIRGSSDTFAERFYRLVSERPRLRGWELELRFLAEIDSYRFMKWYEIPLLQRVAAELAYSFNSDSPDSERLLNEHMYKKISLVIRGERLDQLTHAERSEIPIVAWSHRVDDDPVIEVLATPWARPVLARTSVARFRHKLLADPDAMEQDSNGESRTLTGSHRAAIEAELPNLARDALRHLHNRFQRASAVVQAEEGKTSMLAALLPTPRGTGTARVSRRGNA